MNLVSVETPAPGVTGTRQPPELLDAPLGVVAPGDVPQIVADELIQAFTECLCPFPGAGSQLLVDRQGDIHRHSICARLLCVKRPIRTGNLPEALYEA